MIYMLRNIIFTIAELLTSGTASLRSR